MTLLGSLCLVLSQAVDDTAFFKGTIEPILAQRCFECHGAEGRAKGGLRLTTRGQFLAGGDSGPVPRLAGEGEPEVEAAHEDATLDVSLLLAALHYEDEFLQMPPAGKLADEELAALVEWLGRDAPYGDAKPDAAHDAHDAEPESEPRLIRGDGRTGWAYQPLADSPPAESTPADGRHPIDVLIDARLAAAGLSPMPRADDRTLYRRAHFDLLGLPPVPEELEAYVASTDPQKWTHLVDELLARPEYGERWGRHWLDVVRYAETNGFERDGDKPQIWRYRDWVIDAFNRDLPYDRFVLEQLAGDELVDRDRDSIVASGYLRLAQWDDEPGAGVVQGRYDVLDDIVSTTGQVFLGSTIGCARCHDHKADPFDARHYYEFMAFFHGLTDMSIRGTLVDIANPDEAREAEALEESKRERIRELEQRLAEQRLELETAARGADAAQREGPLRDVRYRFYRDTWTALPDFDALRPEEEGRLEGGYFDLAPRTRDTAIGFVQEATLSLAQGGEFELRLGAEDGARLELDGEETLRLDGVADETRTTVTRRTLAAGDHALRLEWFQEQGRPHLTLELRALEEVARGWRSLSAPEARGGADVAAPERRTVESAEAAFVALVETRADELLGPGSAERITGLRRALERARNRFVPHVVAFAATERGGEPGPLHIHVRGNAHVHGAPVEPAVPEFLATNRKLPIEPTPDGAASGRRTALARWITSPDNPLSARVMVNRVWQHHFGRGLVATANDFGELGERPTHPELLDRLAAEFIASGWSVKALHRFVLSSETWRRASSCVELEASSGAEAAYEAGLALDPTNDLLGRMSVRRLAAEEVRDGMLAVAGMLNPERGGPSVFGRMPAAALATSSTPDKVWGESPEAQRNRRTVYIKVKRSLLTPFLVAHDLADVDTSCPARFTTILPTQALQMLNGSFPHEVATRLAARLWEETAQEGVARESDSALRAFVFRGLGLTLGRAADDSEALAYVALIQDLRQIEGLTLERAAELCCLSFLNLNEFLFVD